MDTISACPGCRVLTDTDPRTVCQRRISGAFGLFIQFNSGGSLDVELDLWL